MICDVVIPARDTGDYVGAAIASALDQSLQPARIIVVDDQSRDGTAAVAAGFGDRVQIVSGEGRSAAAARNLGVRHARSELVAFLDADDLSRPARLARQIHALASTPDAVMAFCDAEFIDASGRASGSAFTCPDFSSDGFLGQLFERNQLLSARRSRWCGAVPSSGSVVSTNGSRTPRITTCGCGWR
jgi:glycosyltransferase involved in cell wall biosynthesis